MITLEWRDTWRDEPDLTAMLEGAATFDAEQGFSAVPPFAGPADARTARELVAWISPDVGSVIAHPRRLPAAFLRVIVDDEGTGVLEITVAPELRSLGIGTLLIETLGWDTSSPDGWHGTGARRLVAWARGSHPAAERMALRFGITTERTMWRIIRPLGPATPPPPADPSEPLRIEPQSPEAAADDLEKLAGMAETEPSVQPERYVARGADGTLAGAITVVVSPPADGDHGTGAVRSVVVEPSSDRSRVNRALLAAALRRISEAGGDEAETLVDSTDDDLVADCQAVGFYHDQTDICYRVSDSLVGTFKNRQA
jgi:mycothiol synthase